ncbi:putative RNA polymerase-associated protein [Clavispora lusitaniae]|uniref:RNA polymerase-associated protein n=2 Tax=Clavispora lusitaniae TaxID=36911 RepID=C4YAE1_CLAL4|nr:uncharacterized protein CLUG_05079 [Clavispora lusitaniae ATCC 42720]KAF7580849.1 Leo1-like family protein [Clavispora lusitaniae]EEQ40951.1 hypothetical protein CLUG_05079 [Clavispora lusitaniae ATCC 42720]QFZ29793.1 putative RNA polymerase-associated protein [Clavispora lusitaniae]QFZ35443.1 putative RNA polymerase-associated protein [Clavispora lusitaniae]QFZ41137.1 putative RNA polymerase-associated protein [Clavispora lusitaniae]
MSDSETSRLSDEEDLFGDDNVAPESDSEQKTLDLSLPRHAVSHKPEEDTFIIKVPVFLQVDAHPFDPNEFKAKVAENARERHASAMDAKAMENDVIAEKLLNQNTLRWRYTNAGNDEIVKQSNAHFVQWDDGSLSLKVGSELFDFRALPLADNFLARSHVDHEVLQNDSILTKTASVLPASTGTATHRQLTQAVKNIQKKDKILNTLTDADPMSKQRAADEHERRSLKLRRQMEQKRRLQEEKLGRTESPAPGRNESAYERFERTYGDEYDDEDDFVANDDEEPEMDDEDDALEEAFERGAERLQSVKAAGAAKYDEEERRKRRRIIDSDDEE